MKLFIMLMEALFLTDEQPTGSYYLAIKMLHNKSIVELTLGL